MKKINGYIKWIGTALAIAAIIWNAAVLHNDVKHIVKDLTKIEQRLEKIEERLWIERDTQ
jgi:hypothetical protein